MAVKPIPEGFNSVSSYLVVQDATKALEFYGKAFGAESGYIMRMPGSDAVLHAEMRIGNSMVMLTSENPQWEMKSALTLGGSPISMHVYVTDANKAFQRAVDAGCDVVAPLMDTFWGDRYGKVKDPFGIQWGIATHIEDVPPEEMGKRAAEWFARMGSEEGQQ